jgi:hypothetical protein
MVGKMGSFGLFGVVFKGRLNNNPSNKAKTGVTSILQKINPVFAKTKK